MHDDSAPAREDWEPTIHPLISYMQVFECGELIGMFMVSAHSQWCWELHMAFLPKAWGPKTVNAGRDFIEWIWRESRCNRLFGQISESNPLSLRLAKAAGMQVYGNHPQSFMKHGIMRDQVLVGISRPKDGE